MTQPGYDREQLREMAESVDFWWHSLDLGHGVVTCGMRTPEALARDPQSLAIPDLKGKTVLDIGAYDGFYSFEAERRGAARVVALDHYVWSLDLPKHIAYWRECKERGITPLPNEQTPHWQPAGLPGKRGYDTAHRALGSRVETVVGDFMTMDLRTLGTFDVVLFLGVLYHMEDPLGSLRRLASVTKGLAIIETHAIAVPAYADLELCEFYSANQLHGDVSNWWGPNVKALEGLCHAAGFSRVETVCGDATGISTRESAFRKARTAAGGVLRALGLRPPVPRRGRRQFRAVVHAWR